MYLDTAHPIAEGMSAFSSGHPFGIDEEIAGARVDAGQVD